MTGSLCLPLLASAAVSAGADGIVPIFGDGRIIVRLGDRLAAYDLRMEP